MPRKKVIKVEKAEKQMLFPPKPREKLTPGQELYCWYPPSNTYHKRIYEKESKDADWVICKEEGSEQRWLVNIEHLHSTVLTKEEYVGQMDK